MHRQLSTLVAMATLSLATTSHSAPAPGTTTPLSVVPASSPLVLHLHGIDRTIDRFVTMAEKVDPQGTKWLKQKAKELREGGVAGRKLAGLDPNGPIFLVFNDLPEGPGDMLTLAILFKTKDYKAFRDGLLLESERKTLTKKNGYEIAALEAAGQGICFVQKGDYTVITPSEGIAGQYTKKRKGLDKALSEAQAKKLLESDLAVYLSMDVFNKEYAEQVKIAREAIDEGIKDLDQMLGKAGAENIRLIKSLIAPAFQAITDSQGLLLTAELRPTALALHVQTELRRSSETSERLSSFKSSSFESIAQLPKDHLYYLSWQSNAYMLRKLGTMITGFQPNKAGDKVLERIEALAKAGPGEKTYSFDMPFQGVQEWQFEKPETAVSTQMALYRSLKPNDLFQSAIVKAAPKIRTDAQKHRGFQFHEIQMAWDFAKTIEHYAPDVAPPAEQRKQLEKAYKQMFGESVHFWLGTNGKTTLQITADKWENAKKLLDDYLDKKGTGSLPTFKQARSHLPKEATFLSLLELERYIAMTMKTMKLAAGGATPLDIPEGKPSKTPAFGGMAITLNARRGSFDLIITTDAARNVGKRYVFPLLYSN